MWYLISWIDDVSRKLSQHRIISRIVNFANRWIGFVSQQTIQLTVMTMVLDLRATTLWRFALVLELNTSNRKEMNINILCMVYCMNIVCIVSSYASPPDSVDKDLVSGCPSATLVCLFVQTDLVTTISREWNNFDKTDMEYSLAPYWWSD